MNAFDLVDIRVTFLLELSTPTPNARRNSNVLVRPAESADVPILQEIARHSHADTRFYADERFPRHLCDALYSTWIARSCTGYADMVFAAEYAQTVAGYISCHLDTKNGQGSIGLLGVDKQARGQNVGQALVGRALEWFAAQHMRTVAVVTQGRNIAAQRLYQKNGFLTKSVQLWYHKWYAGGKRLRELLDTLQPALHGGERAIVYCPSHFFRSFVRRRAFLEAMSRAA